MTTDLTAAVARLRDYTDTYDTYCPKPELRLVLSALEAAQAEQSAATPSEQAVSESAGRVSGADSPATDPIAGLCARLRGGPFATHDATDRNMQQAADAIERLARENAKWRELRRVIAEELGHDVETWPDHGNAPLAIGATFMLIKQRAERAEAERDALRECVRAADAYFAYLHAPDEVWHGRASEELRAGYSAARAKVKL